MQSEHGEPKRIVGVAIYWRGLVISRHAPARHRDLMDDMEKAGLISPENPLVNETQGFLLSNGRFCRRKPAICIAEKANQLIRQPTGGILTSEDVW